MKVFSAGQRKLINDMENLHYEERLRHSGLMRLETRGVRGDLIEVFKFLNRSYTVDADIFFEYDKGNRKGHSKKLFKRRSRLDVRKYVLEIGLLTSGIIYHNVV